MENTLTFDELTNYLKDVKDLEVSKYNQEEIIKQSNDTLKSKLPVKQEIKKPKLQETELLPFPLIYKFSLFLGIFLLAFLIVMVIYFGNYNGDAFLGFIVSYDADALPLGFLMSIAFIGYFFYGKVKYKGCVEEYNEAKEKNEQIYQQELAKYTLQVPLNEKKYSEEKAQYEVAKKQVESLDTPLKETTKILDKVYGKDYIFPKYRNLIAMSTIYEYFVTGRVNELTGPNGAYNLYEQELRQNLIINNLETINTQLETIKNNQFTLYTELKKSNETQQKMLGALTEILNNTDSIAASAEISAYCSRITANNSNYNTWFR